MRLGAQRSRNEARARVLSVAGCLVPLVVAASLVLSACGPFGPSGSPPKAAPPKRALGGSPLPSCGRSPALPDAGTRAFGAGGTIESDISKRLGYPRDSVGVPPETAKPEVDDGTTPPSLTALEARMLDVPGWDQSTVDSVTAGARTPCDQARGTVLARAIEALTARNDMATSGEAVPAEPVPDLDADLDPSHPLREAFRAVFAVDHPWPGKPAASSFPEAQPSIDKLAADLGPASERALARVVKGMARAEEWRVLAVEPWYGASPDFSDMSNLFFTPAKRGAAGAGDGMSGMSGMGDAADPTASGHQPLVPARARSFGAVTMGTAGAGLAWAVERLAVHLRDDPLPESVDFRLATPLGEVALSGKQSDDTWSLDAPALIVDQRGNDTYQGVVAGPASAAIPLSVVIDESGDDHYEGGASDHTQGAGVLSFGYLLDMAGNDTYEARDDTQGIGLLGVGALLDYGGNDTYKARYNAQGAGQFGIGVAVDMAGNDNWSFTSEGQGLGGPRGSGALVDVAGNDVYTADDTNIVNPSTQSPGHNLSDAQGMGTGMRGDRATTMGSGIGLLADLSGDDHYSCGVFCQGAGFWFGHGILYDGAGNDSYGAVWYAQGGAAHFALGSLLDASGDDTYTALTQMADGAGHDRSGGFLLDGAGNDHSAVPRLSHGAANNVGFGFYVDQAGNDTYLTTPTDPGAGAWYGQSYVDGDFVNASRTDGARGLGYFLDAGGADDFRGAPPQVMNNSSWELPPAGVNPPPNLVGLGRDTG